MYVCIGVCVCVICVCILFFVFLCYAMDLSCVIDKGLTD